MSKVIVFGAGGWGTALSLVLRATGRHPVLFARRPEFAEELRRERVNRPYLPGVHIPENLQVDSGVPDFRGAELFVLAVPTQFVRPALAPLARSFPRDLPVVSVVKGIEVGTLKRVSEVVRDVLGRVPVCVLSGPSHAEEVGRRLPTTVVAASTNHALARKVQAAFMTDRFRVYSHTDVKGVELGGAVKNVIAIAAGICDGLGLGDNAKSALLSRGLVEISRLGQALGARRTTFYGISGLGDLVTTCYSPWGRNRGVGLSIGRGKKLSQILSEMKMVAEGVETTRSVLALARRCRVSLPIVEEVHHVLFDDKDPRHAVADLMKRGAKSEIEDFEAPAREPRRRRARPRVAARRR
ncbi:MAG: NAD(P)-dependent glycerol-3-phosphate dehydrogenase [Planctomycetia bacterium]|nr:NAD(P)-dependent glycerol-3-phosphate dehydrogenase [Planctomycetia bacterium]